MPVFHELAVAGLDPLTDDAVRVTLAVPHPLRAEYRFTAGQHLTFALDSEVGPIRRTYSICSTPAAYGVSGELGVGVKILPDGVFSRLVTDRLSIGERLRVMTPAGRFSARPSGPGGRTAVAVVAGSGITPVLSIMTTVLETEPQSRFVLVYGSRRAGSVMFAEELADLKDRFLDRLEIFHVISGEAQTAALLSGRIDAARLDLLLRMHPADEVDDWFVCGPLGLIETTRTSLLEHGVPDGSIHREVFFTGPAPPVALPSGPIADTSITFRLDGRSSTVPLPPAGTVLDAVLAARPDAPFACRNGVCGTCRMRVLSGTVEMRQNFALEPPDLAAGFRLACQSVPSAAVLDVDFDV